MPEISGCKALLAMPSLTYVASSGLGPSPRGSYLRRLYPALLSLMSTNSRLHIFVFGLPIALQFPHAAILILMRSPCRSALLPSQWFAKPYANDLAREGLNTIRKHINEQSSLRLMPQFSLLICFLHPPIRKPKHPYIYPCSRFRAF